MAEYATRSAKRVPIRRRVLATVLVTIFAVLVCAIVTSMYSMVTIMRESDTALSEELQIDIATQVEQKASKTDVALGAYKNYIVFMRDYVHGMYANRDELIARGHYFDSPRATTPKDVYAMQTTFTHDNVNINEYMDDIRFFSNLEPVFEPIAKENEDLIATIYLGRDTGLMVAYDKWSYLVPVPEPDFLVYDYTKSSWYTEGLKADDVFFTGMYVDSMGRGLTITAAAPFTDQEGTFKGVIAADFYISKLYDEMISMDLGEGSSSFAIDKDGKIISVDSDVEISAKEYTGLGDDQIALMTSGKTGVLKTDDAYYAYAYVNSVDWTLCAKVPQSSLLQRMAGLERSFETSLLVFLVISIIILSIGVYLANQVTRSITHPIELLERDMQTIADGDLEHKATAYRNDEIGDMTGRLNQMVDRLKSTLSDLDSAQDTARKMHDLAHADSLTGVGSKIAYDERVRQLETALQDEDVEFGFAIIDLNNLKQTNDTYGHKNGDIALQRLAGILRRVFGESEVFRIGGDEFVVILQGRECDAAADRIAALDAEFARMADDASLKPWERVSASAGFAAYDASVDITASDVFRRADGAMYQRKRSMKQGAGR